MAAQCYRQCHNLERSGYNWVSRSGLSQNAHNLFSNELRIAHCFLSTLETEEQSALAQKTPGLLHWTLISLRGTRERERKRERGGGKKGEREREREGIA